MVFLNSNSISSDNFHRFKTSDNDVLKLNACVLPHANEDELKNALGRDCKTCPRAGPRILESISSLHEWTIYIADEKEVFLQTREGQRDVCVHPPKKSHRTATHL